MIDLISKKHDEKAVIQKRSEVYELLLGQSANIKTGTIETLSTTDLNLLLESYDEVFFQHLLRDYFKGKFKFSLSRRMTKSAGMTLCPKNISTIKPEEAVIEIRIGVDFFFQYGLVEGSKAVCGIRTDNSLEALLLVFEHELCHAMEFIIFHKSSCGKKRFKTIANNVFGHTDSYHKLPTHRQIASKKLGLHVGDTINFTLEGRRISGIIYGINKRATVIVKDPKGNLADKHGIRYSKYYIPLGLLK